MQDADQIATERLRWWRGFSNLPDEKR